jgi:hypothetical protein
MKKILLFIGLVTLGVNAQDIKGGIRLSPNMPTFSNDVKNSSSGKVGYSIGYFETMNLNSNIALQGEINYTNISYEAKGTDFFGVGSSDKSTYSNNFFEIPVLVKYRVSEDFSIGGGLQYCFGGVTDSGGLVDLSYDINNIKIGARYYMGSEKAYGGNSLRNISVSVGFVIF